MDINTRLNVLQQIYHIYDEFSRDHDMACKKGCALCCTQDVTATTLEGYSIISARMADPTSDLFHRLKKESGKKRFSPRLTLNALAGFVFSGKEPPEEDDARTHETCPLLQNNECIIYAYRPFGCRCFFSKEYCGNNDHATIDPFMITVHNVFLQYIEHIDGNGYTASLTDILLLLESDESREQYSKNNFKPAQEFAVNRHLKALLVPPEHTAKIQTVLKELNTIKLPKG